ncbi:hypothetical protein HYT54_00700 [Candidatus Woesearchaeota archaeon]|nr:hypothetical protein [Candidatus Woesearchaeota archaeon]
MGYYTQYFSTLLKGVWATAFKERREAKRAVANLKKAIPMLYGSLFKDIEEHRVTKALNLEQRLIKRLKASLENAYKLLFNEETQESSLLKAVGEIFEALHEFSMETDKRSVSLAEMNQFDQIKRIRREMALAIYAGLKKGESEEREELKPVMLIINMSGSGFNKFMEAVRTAFKEKGVQSALTRFAMRREIGAVKGDINRLRGIKGDIIGLKNKIARGEKLEGVVSKLSGEKDHLQYINEAFYESYLLKKRDMLLVLKALYDLNMLKRFNDMWVGKSWMPQQAVLDRNEAIDEIERKVSQEFHVIAQAFRIMIDKTERLEKVAQRMEGEAAVAKPTKILRFPKGEAERYKKAA